MQKTQIRLNMKTLLANLHGPVRHERSLRACQHLASTKEFKAAQTVMIFLSTPTEIETSTLALKAWEEGKSIAVPRVDWETEKMVPVEITSLDTGLQTVKFGLKEPLEGKVVPLDFIDLVVIPGMAFDRRGYRVGRGRGFYDRFLAEKDFAGVRCGLCFHEQLLREVPAEGHDVPMDVVVTDAEVVHFSRSGRKEGPEMARVEEKD